MVFVDFLSSNVYLHLSGYFIPIICLHVIIVSSIVIDIIINYVYLNN